MRPRTLSTTCIRPLPTPDTIEPPRVELPDLLALARQPWTLRAGRDVLVVRPSTFRDIAAVARMHRRCSARSLLDCYHSGGRPPTVAALDRALRNPHSFVALAPDGTVAATASISRDSLHNHLCAELELLVEDRWQRHGVGSGLAAHIAGVAQVAGFAELITYPATAVPAAQRLMIDIGRTRMVPELNPHLHTYLPASATLGLGSVRQRLAG